MAACAKCRATIVFGPVRDGSLKFCSDECHAGYLVDAALQGVCEGEILEYARALHQSPCPKCGRDHPVAVHKSHYIWSIIHFSSFHSRSEICCGRCGTAMKLNAIVYCFFAGWWGVPVGVLMTPVQLVRNMIGLMRSTVTEQPTDEFVDLARAYFAAAILQAEPLDESPDSHTSPHVQVSREVL